MKDLRFAGMVLLLVLFSTVLFAQDDELTTTGGDVLVGKFVKLEGGNVFFDAPKCGVVKVAAGDVKELVIAKPRDVRWRTGDDVQKQSRGVFSSREGRLYLGDREVALTGIAGIDEDVPDIRPKWDIGALFAFGWTEGNIQTYSMSFRFDIRRQSTFDEHKLFGEGHYFQDRKLKEDSVRRRDYALGYSYRYIFPFNLTLDFTEDLYFNELAGIHYRSTTGLGVGYFIVRTDTTTLHVAGHGTYTKEDQMNGAEDRGYFGARLRAEFETFQLEKTLHIKARAELLFDFDEIKNYVVNDELLVEYKFATYFTAGLLMRHTWDNIPPDGFFHHEFSFLLTLGFSWGGRWY